MTNMSCVLTCYDSFISFRFLFDNFALISLLEMILLKVRCEVMLNEMSNNLLFLFKVCECQGTSSNSVKRLCRNITRSLQQFSGLLRNMKIFLHIIRR